MSGGIDCFNASQCSSDGVPEEILRSWSGLCSCVDVLVGIVYKRSMVLPLGMADSE